MKSKCCSIAAHKARRNTITVIVKAKVHKTVPPLEKEKYNFELF